MSFKEKLEIFKSLSQSFSVLAIPVLVAYMGWSIQAEMKGSEVRKDFVQMAIGIMAQPAETDQQRLLREWASRLLAELSPVPFKRDEMHALQEKPIRIEIPVPVPCNPPVVKEPIWATSTLKIEDGLDTKVRALLAEKLQRQGYEAQLLAALDACRS